MASYLKCAEAVQTEHPLNTVLKIEQKVKTADMEDWRRERIKKIQSYQRQNNEEKRQYDPTTRSEGHKSSPRGRRQGNRTRAYNRNDTNVKGTYAGIVGDQNETLD